MRFRSNRFFIILLVLFVIHPRPSFSLQDNNFRKEDFKWLHAQTEHFDIYYDEKSKKLLPRMAYYLEKAWKEVGDVYNFHVKERTPFFFYSDHNRFEQTNIVSIGEGTGGVTEAFKNRFLIFNDGSENWLAHVIPHEFTHVVEFNILYGGFWKSVRLLKSPFFPLWMMEGAAEYGAAEIDAAQGEMVVRDAIASKTFINIPELHGFGHLKPNQVTLGYKTGEMAIRFLEDEYGRGKAAELIRQMKDFFDVSAALETLLGADLDRFSARFEEWLTDKYAVFIRRAHAPDFYGPQLTSSDGIPQFNTSPVYSKDGKKIYYFSDRGGPTQLFEYDAITKKSRPILPLKWGAYENLQTKGRALSISPDGRWLAFAGEKRQQDRLYLFDLQKRKLKRVNVNVDEIRSPMFSPIDKNTLLITGMKNGFTDLYLIDHKGHIKQKLTDNPQHEMNPTFFPDGQRVVYAGEILTEDQKVPLGYDLFELNLASLKVNRLTNLPGWEDEPEPLPDGRIIFGRDRNLTGELGFNLYEWSPSSASVNQLTDMLGGAFSPHYRDGKLLYVGFQKGEKHLYEMPFEVHPSTTQFQATASVSKGSLDQSTPNYLLNWPVDDSSSLLTNQVRPYKFRASTDLFIPFFFYSSLDGFVFANIWQASDLLGNHQFQEQFQYASENHYLNLGAFYTYARYWPQFTIGYQNEQYYEDIDQQVQRHDVTGIGLVSLPIDRVSTFQLGIGAKDRAQLYQNGLDENSKSEERFWLGAYSWDSVTGRYLVPTKGQRLSVLFQRGGAYFGGNAVYNSILTEGVNYLALPRESTLASRLMFGRSTGRNPQGFRLGGIDRVRGVAGGTFGSHKHNAVVLNNELRFRIAYLNARTKFLFPDFFFKAAYLQIFDDIGVGWDSTEERERITNNSVNHTAGMGVMWPTFILQTFQLQLSIQYGKRTDTGGNIWYIAVGPSF